MSRFTILGAQGLIGSRLTAALARDGHEVFAPARESDLAQRPLGHVIYAIGVTWDFAARVFDTVTAHVCRLNEVLREARFDSLVYLSSTRIYQGLSGSVDENSELTVNPQRMGDLYNLSKLAGESLTLASGRATKIVRISNVFDGRDASDSFLPSVIRSAVTSGLVTLHTAPTSTRDYIALEDVVAMLPQIALEGRQRVYNLCGGHNISHAELARRLEALVPCQVRYAAGAVESQSPRISNERLRTEFGFRPAALFDCLPALIDSYRAQGELSTC
jgi:nucleoside-diphosphate-sugar epimerase